MKQKYLRDDCAPIVFAPKLCLIYIIGNCNFSLSLKQRVCCPLCHLDSSATFFSMNDLTCTSYRHHYNHFHCRSQSNPNVQGGWYDLNKYMGPQCFFCFGSLWNFGALGLGLLDFEDFDGAVCTTVPSLTSSLQIPFQSKWPSPFDMWMRRLTVFLHGGSSDSGVSKMQVH